jgi:hypothetical protein
MENKGNPNAENVKGETPIALARQSGYESILAELSKEKPVS